MNDPRPRAGQKPERDNRPQPEQPQTPTTPPQPESTDLPRQWLKPKERLTDDPSLAPESGTREPPDDI